MLFLLYGVPGDLKRATNLSYFQSDIIDRPSLQIKANGYFMAHMSNLMCTFFLVLSLTLSFSVLFEPNDCLKIIATLLMEQSRTQLPYYVITFTKSTFSRKWPATYHCKNEGFFFPFNNMSYIWKHIYLYCSKILIALVLYVQSWIKNMWELKFITSESGWSYIDRACI